MTLEIGKPIDGSEACEGRIVNGIEVYPLRHSLPPPFIGTTNITDVAGMLVKRPSSVISSDGFGQVDAVRLVNGDPRSLIDNDYLPIFDAAADVGSTLVFADFSTFSGEYLDMKHTLRNIGIGVGISTAASIGYYLEESFRNKTPGQRRATFIKSGALMLASLIASASVPGLMGKVVEDSIKECNLDGPLNQLTGLNGDFTADLVARTAFTLIKHGEMQDSGFIPEKPGGNISLWGLSHIQNDELFEQIRTVVEDPTSMILKLIDREIAFLLSQNLPQSEVLDFATTTWLGMAEGVGINLTKDEEGKLTAQYSNPDIFYISQRIIGFDPSGMNYKEIRQKTKEQVLDRMLALQQ